MKVVILAGGSGTRLWPVSRSSYPKQCIQFGSPYSLLQKTIRRCLPFARPHEIFLATHQELFPLVREQVTEINPILAEQILIEPVRRNTAPAIALAIRACVERGGAAMDEPILVCPADHLMTPEEEFVRCIEYALSYVQEPRILIFGAYPNRPETGYGYIKATKPPPAPVECFIEKPDRMTAISYLEQGGYLWNAGMFLLTSQTFWQEVAEHCPPLLALQPASSQEVYNIFPSLPDISFDYAIMEKTKRAFVVPLSLTWSDIGSWDSVYEVMDKDPEGNVRLGNVYTAGTRNSLFFGGMRWIAASGVENILVVDTDDVLFIGQRGNAQQVKKLVEELKARGIPCATDHSQSRSLCASRAEQTYEST